MHSSAVEFELHLSGRAEGQQEEKGGHVRQKQQRKEWTAGRDVGVGHQGPGVTPAPSAPRLPHHPRGAEPGWRDVHVRPGVAHYPQPGPGDAPRTGHRDVSAERGAAWHRPGPGSGGPLQLLFKMPLSRLALTNPWMSALSSDPSIGPK